MRRWVPSVGLWGLRHAVRTWTERHCDTAVRLVGRNLVQIDSRRLVGRLSKLIRLEHRYLMVHSSLAACGRVKCGEQTLVDAVHQFCETLCLPTHSYCYPPSHAEV